MTSHRTPLPLIVAMGGMNAAGRSSGHHAYRRMVIDKLSQKEQRETIQALAAMTGIDADLKQEILDSTLIRRVEANHFDPDKVPWLTPLDAEANNQQPIEFECKAKQLPVEVPESWQLTPLDDGRVKVQIVGAGQLHIKNTRKSPVQSAGQLPTGFDPAAQYNSRFHPRGLQMSVVAASDALQDMGLDWDTVMDKLPPDAVAVYSGSVMAQLDDNGYGGLMQSRLKGSRVSSKQLALGLNTMPADFVNAYVLGSMGATGSVTGACATFLYNLRAGVEDIQSGRRQLVFVGNAEAPLTSEVFEGYGAMGALATDEGLAKLDGGDVNHRRASRPFGENCGFTLAESSQYIVLMNDSFALEMGAKIYGAVSDVFINADGFKKSISAPGPGNYITLAKSVAAAKALHGEDLVRHHSMVQAHGSSTPQNRVTESRILDRVAETFQIDSWPVSAVKAYVGHSLAPASADQMVAVLGQFQYGWMPGLKTVDSIASDVVAGRLNLSLGDLEVPNTRLAFINSKGFGGNNATATVIHPQRVEEMLEARHGKAAMTKFKHRQETTIAASQSYESAVSQGDWRVRYRFGENMVDETQIQMSQQRIVLPGYACPIEFSQTTVYSDMQS